MVLGGGTDVGLWVTKQLRDLPPIVYYRRGGVLQRIEISPQGLRIGAAVSLTDAWAALIDQCPALREVAERFGSPPVRNSGTLCGNLANGSPDWRWFAASHCPGRADRVAPRELHTLATVG